MARNAGRMVITLAFIALLGTAHKAAAANGVSLTGTYSFHTVSSSAPSEDGWVVQEIVGRGTGTVLGDSTVLALHLQNIYTGQFFGVFVVTASNGDKMYGTAAGQLYPDGSLEEALEFDGGTGKFAHATGAATGTGELDFITGQATETITGTISGVYGR
jgi:hypothetical protein